MNESKLYCPCGGELTLIGTTHTGHTHQCKTCGELHAPFGHTEPTESVRFLVALEYDEAADLHNHREHQPEDFSKAQVTDNAVIFRFTLSREQTETLRSLLRIVAGMDSPANRDLNLVEQGDLKYIE